MPIRFCCILEDMKTKTHQFANGIKNGYPLEDEDMDVVAKWLLAGFRNELGERSPKYGFGEVASQELAAKLIEHLSRRDK